MRSIRTLKLRSCCCLVLLLFVHLDSLYKFEQKKRIITTPTMNVCVIVLFVAKQCGNESSFRCHFCCFAKDDDDWLGCWFFEPPSDKQGKVNCRSVGWTNTPANSVYKHIHTNIQKFGKYTFFLGGGRAEGHVCVVSVDAKSSVCFLQSIFAWEKRGNWEEQPQPIVCSTCVTHTKCVCGFGNKTKNLIRWILLCVSWERFVRFLLRWIFLGETVIICQHLSVVSLLVENLQTKKINYDYFRLPQKVHPYYQHSIPILNFIYSHTHTLMHRHYIHNFKRGKTKF